MLQQQINSAQLHNLAAVQQVTEMMTACPGSQDTNIMESIKAHPLHVSPYSGCYAGS